MANDPGMTFGRVLLVLAALTVALTGGPADAASENPYWRVETNLPVETIQGEWSVAENGRSATVEFDGVNVVGQTTTFTAGWRTGWFKASQGQRRRVLVPHRSTHNRRSKTDGPRTGKGRQMESLVQGTDADEKRRRHLRVGRRERRDRASHESDPL